MRRLMPGPLVAEPEGWQDVQEAPAPGPRLCTLIWMRMSSGDALAYSTNTSQ